MDEAEFTGRLASQKEIQLWQCTTDAEEDYLELILRMARKQCSSAPEIQQKVPEEHLTMMESIILGLIGKGKSNAEICEELNLKLSTVKSHIYSLYRKLGVKNRMQATIKGKEMGILK